MIVECFRIVRYCLSEHFAVDPDRFMDCKPNSRPVRAWRQGVLQRGIHFEAEMFHLAEVFHFGFSFLSKLSVITVALRGRHFQVGSYDACSVRKILPHEESEATNLLHGDLSCRGFWFQGCLL